MAKKSPAAISCVEPRLRLISILRRFLRSSRTCTNVSTFSTTRSLVFFFEKTAALFTSLDRRTHLERYPPRCHPVQRGLHPPRQRVVGAVVEGDGVAVQGQRGALAVPVPTQSDLGEWEKSCVAHSMDSLFCFLYLCFCLRPKADR